MWVQAVALAWSGPARVNSARLGSTRLDSTRSGANGVSCASCWTQAQISALWRCLSGAISAESDYLILSRQLGRFACKRSHDDGEGDGSSENQAAAAGAAGCDDKFRSTLRPAGRLCCCSCCCCCQRQQQQQQQAGGNRECSAYACVLRLVGRPSWLAKRPGRSRVSIWHLIVHLLLPAGSLCCSSQTTTTTTTADQQRQLRKHYYYSNSCNTTHCGATLATNWPAKKAAGSLRKTARA